MTLEQLKKYTFNQMCNRGEIATNSDNEKWVNDLIQIGFDFKNKNKNMSGEIYKLTERQVIENEIIQQQSFNGEKKKRAFIQSIKSMSIEKLKDLLEEINPDKFEICEGCGKNFHVDFLRMDKEDGNWFCTDCLIE